MQQQLASIAALSFPLSLSLPVSLIFFSTVHCVPSQVIGYYSGEENAYDMRKAMARDVKRKSVVPLKKPVHPEDLEFD